MDHATPSNCEVQMRRIAESPTRQLGRHGMRPVGTMQAAFALCFIGTVASTLRGTVTHENPTLECALPGYPPFDGARAEASAPPAVDAPMYSIRRKVSAVFTLAEYKHRGILSAPYRQAIEAAVAQCRNIRIVGGTGSGKTTLIKAVIAQIVRTTPQHRLVIIDVTCVLQRAADIGCLCFAPRTPGSLARDAGQLAALINEAMPDVPC
jgi:type IV secretion system protein TrbB